MVEKTGGGRAPCCDKTKVKRGPWSPDEDLRLTTFIRNYGHTNWRALPKQAGLLRCGKSCRLRWINYLTPDVKRGNFTPQEEQTIINLHNSFGNKWSKIASYLPGRTDNEIKNMWNTHLKKRLKNNHSSILANSSCSSFTLSSFSSSKDQCSGQLKKVDIDRVVQESKSPKPNKDDSNNSPASSYASNFTNSNDATSEFSKFVEVAHDTEIHDDEEIEIPLESDTDFWNLFDSLDTDLESNNNINVVSNSNIINPVEKVDDGNDWFRLLENELGLTCDVDMNLSKDQKHVPTTLEPEIGPGLDYFPIWPSSPQNLGI